MDIDNPIYIGKYTLRQTSSYCPEQYDVFHGAKQVGYVRLRGGLFKVYSPDHDGEMIESEQFDDDCKGEFSSAAERREYLNRAVNAIRDFTMDNARKR